MDITSLLRQRLLNQQLVHTRFSQPGDIVSCMGAMQAQDYGWMRWALGIRFPEPLSCDIRGLCVVVRTECR